MLSNVATIVLALILQNANLGNDKAPVGAAPEKAIAVTVCAPLVKIEGLIIWNVPADDATPAAKSFAPM